jgi:hypothetical protein
MPSCLDVDGIDAAFKAVNLAFNPEACVQASESLLTSLSLHLPD